MDHVILHELGAVDERYPKNRSNACYLLTEDGGDCQRDPATGKPLVRDAVLNAAVPFDSGHENRALEGAFEVSGRQSRPGFDWVKEACLEFTPEWAEEIRTVPAGAIRRLATEFAETARIGSAEREGGVAPGAGLRS